MRALLACLLLLLLGGCDPGPSYERLGVRRVGEQVEILLALCEGEAITGITAYQVGEGGEDEPIWRVGPEEPTVAAQPAVFELTLFETPAGYVEALPFPQVPPPPTLAVDFELGDHQTSISFELDELDETSYYVNALNPAAPQEQILSNRDDFCATE